MSVRKGSHVLRAAGLVLSVEVLGITLDQDGKCLARQRILGASEPKTHTEPYLHELHRRTFDRTWKWAGTDRNTEKNIGILAHEIRNSTHASVARYHRETKPSRIYLGTKRYRVLAGLVSPTSECCAQRTAETSDPCSRLVVREEPGVPAVGSPGRTVRKAAHLTGT